MESSYADSFSGGVTSGISCAKNVVTFMTLCLVRCIYFIWFEFFLNVGYHVPKASV